MKKKTFRAALSLLLALAALLPLAVTANAAVGVTFADGKLIAFAPGSAYAGSDLFGSFKDVMPGDVRTERITVQNSARDCDFIKVYLRAVPHDAAQNPVSEPVRAALEADPRRGDEAALAYMHDFLAQLRLKVTSGETLLYDAPPDGAGGLAQNVLLGTLRRGESLTLDAALTVPLDLDNRYANRIGEVDWVFTVEAFDDPTPPPEDDATLTVRKVWVDGGLGRPDSVVVHLLRDGAFQEAVELNRDNQWTYTWTRLDEDARWTAVEANVPQGYTAATVTWGSVTTITNTRRGYTPSGPAQPTDLTVVKRWEDKGKGRPDAVKVTLYDGSAAVESVWLGDWNDWTYTWRGLGFSGQVVETNIPDGYAPLYAYRGGVVTVTNAAILIQTGQLHWPVPVLGALGLLLVAGGVLLLARRRGHDRG